MNKHHRGEHFISFGWELFIVFIALLTLVSLSFISGGGGASISHAYTQPVLVGSYDSLGAVDANDVFFSKKYAYVGTNNNTGGSPLNPEFYIVDVSDPAAPVLTGSLNLDTFVNKVHVLGNYAYLATTDNTRELIVVDVHDPSGPFVAGSFDAAGLADGVAVFAQMSRVYLGTENNTGSGAQDREFRVLDVSNPANITQLGSYEISARVNDIFVEGETAYLATTKNGKGIIVLDVANQSAIVERASYDVGGNDDGRAVFVNGGKAYLTTANALANPDFYVFSTSATSPLQFLGSLDLGSTNSDVQVFRNLAYLTVSGSAQGLKVVDVSNPAAPSLLGSLNMGGGASGLSAGGNFLYLATPHNSKELQVVDPKAILQPNVIIINADDMRDDDINFMPLTNQRLIQQGVRFVNSFVPTSQCCPSRGSLLTGLYHHSFDLGQPDYANPGPAKAFHDSGGDQYTLATVLDEAGYATGLFGKYMNNYDELAPVVPPGWDTWRAFGEGWGGYYHYELVTESGQYLEYNGTSTNYSTDVFRDMATEFITQNAGKPFFAFVNPYAPHSAGEEQYSHPTPAVRHRNMFQGTTYSSPSYCESDITDKPAWMEAWLSPCGDESILQLGYQRRLESLQAVDEAVAAIVNTVESLGLSNNTVIIYTSDNGLNLKDHRYQQKLLAYDTSIRVPLVVRYPWLIPSSRSETNLALNLDIPATLADLTGTNLSRPGNGMSLFPVLKNGSPNGRTDFFLEFLAVAFGGPPTHRGVRTADGWKYIFSDGIFGLPEYEFEELYDLNTDPWELDNLLVTASSSPSVQAKATELRNRLQQLIASE